MNSKFWADRQCRREEPVSLAEVNLVKCPYIISDVAKLLIVRAWNLVHREQTESRVMTQSEGGSREPSADANQHRQSPFGFGHS